MDNMQNITPSTPPPDESGEEGAKEQKKRGKKRYIVMGILAVAAIGAVYAANWLHKATNIEAAFADDFAQTPAATVVTITPSPSPTPTEEETIPPSASSAPTPTPTPTLSPEELLAQESDPEFLKKRVNVLLLGLDRSKERGSSGSFRTDTMILVSVNLDDKEATMISIPRDSFVKIHNKKARGKINTAFGVGGGSDRNGYEYAMKTVSNLFGGVTVDYYVGFDMQLVKDVVDVIGGVDYDVDIEVRMNGRELHPGQQHLDGQAVLDYCRIRKGSSDIARVDRQQRMLLAIFDELKSNNQILNIPKIYTAVMDNMDTNLSLQQISSLALFANEIGLDNIGRHTVEGDYLFMYETSYWGISNSKLKTLVKEVFGKDISPNREDDVYYVKARYQEELAAAAALELEALGAEGEEGAGVDTRETGPMDTPGEALTIEPETETPSPLPEGEGLQIADEVADALPDENIDGTGGEATETPMDANENSAADKGQGSEELAA